jgi:hypothetical protein
MLNRPLPARPWLRRDTPLLWRTGRTLQVGEAERTVVITDPPRDLINWARGLLGNRTLAECLSDCPDAATGTAMLRALSLAGALDDAAHAPTTTAHLPRALRDRDQRHAGAARLTYPDQRAETAVDARSAARIGVFGQGPLAHAVRTTLRQSGIGHVRTATPPSSAARIGRNQASGIDLFILAHAWHPDSFDDAGCLALDVPHLPVAAWGSLGTVGPLVVPGHTPCLRCGYLHAADQDRAFPTVHLQRSYARVDTAPVDTALALAVAAHAVMTVCSWVESGGGPPGDQPQPSSTRLHLRLPGGHLEQHHVAAHPLCGCRWRGGEAA